MNNVIKKERIHLFSPSANVCVIARLSKALETEELQNAVNKTIKNYEILCSKVVLKEDGSAIFEAIHCEKNIVVHEYSCRWEEAAAKEETIPFEINNGETIRFFYNASENELLVITHHIVADGGSIMIFMDDLLKTLSNVKVTYKPIRLFTEDDLPKNSRLNFFMRNIIKSTNSKWVKSGKVFTADDFASMFSKYQKENKSSVLMQTFDKDFLFHLQNFAHIYSVSLNSIFTAAFSKEALGENIGIAVNVRPKGFKGMGNYATGIGLKHSYDTRMDILENAEIIHKEVTKILNSPKKKYFLSWFMNSLSPTLVDSMYFSLTGLYENTISNSIRKMCGYVENPKGISITNLKNITENFQDNLQYRYTSLFFVPPYIPNVKRVIGISTFNNTLTITSHFKESESIIEREIFDTACRNIKSLVS